VTGRGTAAGRVKPGFPIPKTAVSGTPPPVAARPGQPVPETSPRTACGNAGTGTVSGTIGTVTREVVETVRESLVIGSL